MLKDALSSLFAHVNAFVCGQFSAPTGCSANAFAEEERRHIHASDCRQKAIFPLGGRIALSANERIAEFLNLAIQAKFAYVNKLRHIHALSVYLRLNST